MTNPFLPPPEPWMPKEDNSFGHQIEDIALAVPRGAAGFAQGVYGLADTITGDSLPDWKTNPFGESDTILGGLAEGATQFALGFIPVAGWGRWGGLLGKAGWAAKEGFGLAQSARALTAGAITDFAVWQGHQDRLSNLIQSNPSLANPITAFLANDPDDSEIVGRLKGALEGAGLGVAVDATMAGIRKLAVYSKVRTDALAKVSGEVTPDIEAKVHAQAAEAAEKAVPESQIRELYESRSSESAIPDKATPPVAQEAVDASEALPATSLPVEPKLATEAPIASGAEPSVLPKLDTSTELGHSLASHMANAAKYGYDPALLEKSLKTIESVVDAHEGAGLPLGVNPRNLSGPQLLSIGLEKNSINLSNRLLSDEGAGLIRATQEMFNAADTGWKAEAISEQGFAQQAAEGIAQLAEVMDAQNPEAMHASIAQMTSRFEQSTKKLAANTQAMVWLANSMSEDAVKSMRLAQDIVAGKVAGNKDLAILKALEKEHIFTRVSATLRGGTAEVARALGGLRAKTAALPLPHFDDFADRPELLEKFVAAQGGEKNIIDRFNKMVLMYSDGGINGTMSFGKAANAMRQGLLRRSYDAFLETWINFLVSGPKTIAVNATGTMAFSYFKPIEALAGSAVLKATGNAAQRTAQSHVMRGLVVQASEMHNGLADTVRTAKRLGLDRPDMLGSGAGSSVMDTIARRKALTAEKFPELDQTGWAAHAINWLGDKFRIPSGVLGTTDNIIKTQNYRAVAKGRVWDMELAKGTHPEKIPEIVEQTIDRLIWDHQVYSQDQLFKRGLNLAEQQNFKTASEKALFATDYANTQMALHPEDQGLHNFSKSNAYDSTLSTPAQPGSVSMNVQNFSAQHPWMRMIAPFVNISTNIVKATGQRLDGLSVARYLAGQVVDPKYMGLQTSKTRFIQQMVHGDAREQAEAVGRIATGVSVATTAYSLMGSGFITGGGPSDPAHKKTLIDAGWQPYSFKVGDGYVAYNRFDPFASLLGTMADIYEYGMYAPHGAADESPALTTAIAVALANNLTNKTYLTGVANFIDMARQPDRKMESFFRSYAGTIVPNFIGQATGALGGDDVLRDVNSMVDAARNKIPGLSKTLPPQRNALGEPMSRAMSLGGRVTDWWLPVGYREVSDDKVKIAMAQTGHAFSAPSSTWNGVDLNSITVGSTTAYDRWGALQGTVAIGGIRIKDALRKVIATQAYQRSIASAVGETESPRVNMLNAVIFRYRDAAWRQLLRESPELAANASNIINNKLAARRGDLFSLGR